MYFLRMIQFTIQIGSALNMSSCMYPQSQEDSVLVQYSLDHGVTWSTLAVIEGIYHKGTPHTKYLDLPKHSRQSSVIFRWWQPLRECKYY